MLSICTQLLSDRRRRPAGERKWRQLVLHQCDTQPLTTPGVLTSEVFDISTDGAGTYDVTVGDASGSCP
jgi:hypothetical protein